MDNPLLAPTLDELRRHQGLKWRLYGDDVLPLWVAEMDVFPPEPVVRAVTDAMRRGDTGYPGGHAYADGGEKTMAANVPAVVRWVASDCGDAGDPVGSTGRCRWVRRCSVQAS